MVSLYESECHCPWPCGANTTTTSAVPLIQRLSHSLSHRLNQKLSRLIKVFEQATSPIQLGVARNQNHDRLNLLEILTFYVLISHVCFPHNQTSRTGAAPTTTRCHGYVLLLDTRNLSGALGIAHAQEPHAELHLWFPFVSVSFVFFFFCCWVLVTCRLYSNAPQMRCCVCDIV